MLPVSRAGEAGGPAVICGARLIGRTCHEWTDRLESNRARAIELAGDKRFRIRGIYLAGCAYSFREGWINIYQALACKAGAGRNIRLPLTRDYMHV